MIALLVSFAKSRTARYIALLLACLVALGIFGQVRYASGYKAGFGAAESKYLPIINTLRTEALHVKAKALDVQAALTAKANQLAQSLADVRLSLEAEQLKAQEYVQKYASPVRRALSPDIVGMLNRQTGIRETVEPIAGEPASGASPASAPLAPNSQRFERSASELSVAGWITGAIKSHESCRQQVDRLITYAQACASAGVEYERPKND